MIEYSQQAYDICKRPYVKYVMRDSDGFYISVCQEFNQCKEFMGCYSQGDTSDEAFEMLEDAMLLWVQCALDDGYSIPEPSVAYTNDGHVMTITSEIDFSEFWIDD